MYIPDHFIPYQCAICLEKIECFQTVRNRIVYPKHETNVYITSCRHVYHKICIKTWFMKNNNCPQCRAHVYSDTSFSPLTFQIVIDEELFENDTDQESGYDYIPETILYKYNYFDNACMIVFIYHIIQNLIHACTSAMFICMAKEKRNVWTYTIVYIFKLI